MSQENVERAVTVLDAVTRRDLPRLIELTDPDVEWWSFFAALGVGLYRGHDGLRQYLLDLDDALDVVNPVVENGVGIGDVALAVGRINYRGKASGVEAASPAGWMFKFQRGKVVRFRAFQEPEQALEAVGLAE